MMEDSQFVHLFNGARIAYPPNDKVARYLYEGWFEANDMAFVAQFLTDGDVFVDVGAHAGLYSVIARHSIGETGQIIACDPNPAILPWLERNLLVTANMQPGPLTPGQTAIINQGVADRCGTADFFLGVEGSTAYASLEVNQFTVEKTTIKLTTLDTIVSKSQLERIDFVKVDVEGAEGQFLEGAAETIRANPDLVIMMEFDENNRQSFGETTQSLFTKLKKLNLQAFDVDIINQSVHLVDDSKPLWHKNLVLARNSKLIKRRLRTSSEGIRIRSIDKAKSGHASASLYNDRQNLKKLINRLQGPTLKIGNICSKLSSQSSDDSAVEQITTELGDDSLSRSVVIDKIVASLDEDVDRLGHMVDAVAQRLTQDAQYKQEIIAAVARLEGAVSGVGELFDNLTMSPGNSVRIKDAIEASIGASTKSPEHIDTLSQVINDEIGRLGTVADTYIENERITKQNLEETSKGLSQLAQAVASIGNPLDKLTHSSGGMTRLLKAIGENIGDEIGLPQSVNTLSQVINDEIGRLEIVADTYIENVAIIDNVEGEIPGRAQKLAQSLDSLNKLAIASFEDNKEIQQDMGFTDFNYNPANATTKSDIAVFISDCFDKLDHLSDTAVESVRMRTETHQDDATLFHETYLLLSGETERLLTELENATQMNAYSQGQRKRLREMGGLILTLRRSRLLKIANKLNLKSSNIVSQLVNIYCCVDDEVYDG